MYRHNINPIFFESTRPIFQIHETNVQTKEEKTIKQKKATTTKHTSGNTNKPRKKERKNSLKKPKNHLFNSYPQPRIHQPIYTLKQPHPIITIKMVNR